MAFSKDERELAILWSIANESPAELLRHSFTYEMWAKDEVLFPEPEDRQDCRESVRLLREAIFDYMTENGLNELREGPYVAKLSTGLGGSLITRIETAERGL